MNIQKPPSHLDAATQRYLNHLRDAIVDLQGSNTLPPRTPTNLQVSPQPGGNNIVFTVSDADTYQLFVGSSPDFTQAKVIELGSTNQYSDTVGVGGVQRWYWVRGIRSSKGTVSPTLGPISATTLALGTPAHPVPLVPGADRIYTDSTTRNLVIKDQSREVS
jgi:hypothetical protein